MPQNECLHAKTDFDRAENQPSKIWKLLALILSWFSTSPAAAGLLENDARNSIQSEPFSCACRFASTDCGYIYADGHNLLFFVILDAHVFHARNIISDVHDSL